MDYTMKSDSNWSDISSNTSNDNITDKNEHIDYVFEKDIYEKRILDNDLKIYTVNNYKDFKRFYDFSFKLYKDDPFWVAPFWFEMLDFFKIKNPFWSHSKVRLFIALKNEKIVGRIAAIIDYKYCETSNKKVGFFGFFECIDDFNIAKALFEAVQDWLYSKDIKIILGPINGRIDNGCGFLIEGFNSPPSLLSSYSPSYYISFAEKFNMKKSRDLWLYYIDLTKPFTKKLKDIAKKFNKSEVKIRPFNRLHTRYEIDWWSDLFLETFKDHWGYVPVSSQEVKSRFGVKQIRWFVDPKLFLIAEYKDVPVAYIWATPEYNQVFHKMNGMLNPIQLLKFLYYKKNINIGKMLLIGIKKEFRNKGIGSYLNYLILVEMKNRGYIGSEVGWIDEKNTSAHKTIAITGAKVYKKFRVFEKELNI